MEKYFAVISGLFALAASPPYIIDTLNNKTKPQRMTWFIFTVLSTIALISQWSLGASWSLVFLALDALASLIVLVLSLSRGVGGYTRLDMLALAIALAGALVSILVDKPIIALLGVIIADLAGVLLTIKKTYQEPASETTLSWLLFGFAASFGALAVGKVELELLLYPIYIAIVCFAVPVTQFISNKLRRPVASGR